MCPTRETSCFGSLNRTCEIYLDHCIYSIEKGNFSLKSIFNNTTRGGHVPDWDRTHIDPNPANLFSVHFYYVSKN